MSKRKHIGRGVSLDDAMRSAVDKRIAELRPWVKGFSAYVQRLIYLEFWKKTVATIATLGNLRAT